MGRSVVYRIWHDSEGTCASWQQSLVGSTHAEDVEDNVIWPKPSEEEIRKAPRLEWKGLGPEEDHAEHEAARMGPMLLATNLEDSGLFSVGIWLNQLPMDFVPNARGEVTDLGILIQQVNVLASDRGHKNRRVSNLKRIAEILAYHWIRRTFRPLLEMCA